MNHSNGASSHGTDSLVGGHHLTYPSIAYDYSTVEKLSNPFLLISLRGWLSWLLLTTALFPGVVALRLAWFICWSLLVSIIGRLIIVGSRLLVVTLSWLVVVRRLALVIIIRRR